MGDAGLARAFVAGAHGKPSLVTDDRWENRVVLVNLLLPLGFEVIEAVNGSEALDKASAYQPDLIFMDLFMPEMNGDEACRLIKKNSELAAIPIVMVTQGGREKDVALCREAGCDEVLFKPINRHLFMETANRFLELVNRQHPRVMARLQIRYGSDPQLMLTDYALNICDGGIFIATAKPDTIKDPLSLEFVLPDRPKPVCCQGRISWLNEPGNLKRQTLPPGMGIQFLDLDLDDLHAIQEFIKQECLTPSW